MKRILAAALSTSMLFSVVGCAAPVDVTEENAPTELMKKAAALSSESEGSDVLEVFTEIINTTAESADYRLAFNQSVDSSSLSEEDGEIQANKSKVSAYDVRYAGDNCFYELYEQDYDGQTTAGLSKMDDVNADAVFMDITGGKLGSESAELEVANIQENSTGEESTGEDLTPTIQNTVIYPLYTYVGQSLAISPTVNPEYYDFKLTRTGDDYTLTLSMKDQEEYNNYLDTFFEENYGYQRLDLKGDGSIVVDVYETSEVTITMTMDENGVLKKITSKNVSSVGDAEEPLQIYADQSVTIAPAAEVYNTFFDKFFTDVKNGEITEGDSFTIATFEEKGVTKPEKTNAEDESAENAGESNDNAEESSESDSQDQTESSENTDDQSNEDQAQEVTE